MSKKNTYYIYLNDKGHTLNPKQKRTEPNQLIDI
jgi:hypothetical protein